MKDVVRKIKWVVPGLVRLGLGPVNGHDHIDKYCHEAGKWWHLWD